MTNSEIQNILIKLQRATCCGKLKVVDELPEGNSGNGFVVFEDELYYWDGDEWIVVGGGGALPTFKTINGETIDDGPGDIVVGGTGLETLDEGNGIGWRLVGRNPANYGNIGNNAIDLSFSSGSSSSRGATGVRAFAGGQNVEASGNFSTVFGADNVASSDNTMSWGQGSTADGTMTTAFGWGNTASSLTSVVLGTFATLPVGQTSFPFVLTDEQFKIGNGVDSSNRSDAFTVYKNAIQKQGGITAANASAMTPENGMTAYLIDTDATFTSVGFWGYENGSWKKFTLI